MNTETVFQYHCVLLPHYRVLTPRFVERDDETTDIFLVVCGKSN